MFDVQPCLAKKIPLYQYMSNIADTKCHKLSPYLIYCLKSTKNVELNFFFALPEKKERRRRKQEVVKLFVFITFATF